MDRRSAGTELAHVAEDAREAVTSSFAQTGIVCLDIAELGHVGDNRTFPDIPLKELDGPSA